MATLLYKDNEKIQVEAIEVEPHLIHGWSVRQKTKVVQKKKVAAKPVPKAASIPTLNKVP